MRSSSYSSSSLETTITSSRRKKLSTNSKAVVAIALLVLSGFQSLDQCSSFVVPTTTTTRSSFASSTRRSPRRASSKFIISSIMQMSSSSSSSSSVEEQQSKSSSSSVNNNNNNNNNNDKPIIRLYNSLSNTKEDLKPLIPNKISMYTCGPTVYDYAHVGNFRAFLTYDVLKRVLLYFNYDVDHICNLTDVDDKIIKKCKIEQKSLLDVTRLYEDLFKDDLKALNIIPARKYPRATEHINEMVQMIQDLEKVGLAYQSEKEGSWYFNVAAKEGYGTQLVKLDVSNMKQNASGLAGAQRTSSPNGKESVAATDATTATDDDDMDADEYDADKVGVRDFALWKAYKPNFDIDDATWDTPIGKGRPGWHLECSAMAKKYLGESIDIHCGGIDLKFPHHENEIAQSEGAMMNNNNNNNNNGKKKKFCNCWVHNGFVNIGKDNEKMSKSKGNFLTLRTACPKAVDVRAYRYLIVSSQYRNPLSFTKQAMGAAKGALSRLDNLMKLLNDELDGYEKDNDNDTTTTTTDRDGNIAATVSQELLKFETALADDINMPRASASLFGVIKAAEAEFKRLKKAQSDLKKGKENVDLTPPPLDKDGLSVARDAILQMDQVFGLLYTVPPARNEDGTLVEGTGSDDNESGSGDDVQVPDDVMELVRSRSAAKEAKDWDLADSLRKRISELGFAVKDVKGGDPIISRL